MSCGEPPMQQARATSPNFCHIHIAIERVAESSRVEHVLSVGVTQTISA